MTEVRPIHYPKLKHKTMKRLLYVVLGLFLFGIQSPLNGQVNTAINYGEKGYFAPLGWLSSPKSSKYVSSVYPATPTTLTDFYYINGQGNRIDFKVGNTNGGNFTAGVGLNVSNGVISLNQWPMLAGTIGLSGLFFDPQSLPPLISPSNMVTGQGHMLGMLNNQAVRVSLADYHNYLKTIIGSTGGGSDSGLKWVKPPADQNAPGSPGEYSYYMGNFYFNAQTGPLTNQWLQWPVNPTFISGYVDSTSGNSPPALSGQYNAFTRRIDLAWSTTLTNVASWDVFLSYNGGGYNLEVGGIPAGSRTHPLVTNGDGSYKLVIRAKLANGSVSPFSNEITVTVAPGGAEFLPVTNVVLTPLNNANAIKVDFTTQDANGEAVLQITSNPNATASGDDSWTSLASVAIGNTGTYSYTFTGINDQNARWVRIWRSGTGKAESAKQKFGPVSLTAVSEPVNAPTLVSVTAGSNGTSAIINYTANNSSYTRLDLYRSEDGGNTFGSAINAGNSGSSYTDNGLTAGKTYVYRAQVLKNNTFSAFSATKSVTMPGVSQQAAAPIIQSYRAGGVNTNTILFSFNGETPGTYDRDISTDGGAWQSSGRALTSGIDVAQKTGNWGLDTKNPSSSDVVIRYRVRSNISGKTQSLWSNIIKVTFLPGYDDVTNRSAYRVEFENADQSATGQVPPSAQALQFSATNVTESSITISIINPSNAGTINYNWAIYAGDPNTANTYRCSKYDNPSSGTLTISTSACTDLAAGQQYRLYLAQSNGAGKPQTRQSYITFTQPGNTGGGGGAVQWGVVPSDAVAPPGGIYYMENNQLRIGLNMNAGGAIWEAYHADDPNTQLVNDADYGRQWQYAYYAFPVDGYKPNGKDPADPMWSGIGYDPIQAGDFTTPSRVLQFKEDKANNMVYFRTRPRLWGYRDIEASCYVDTWIKITGNFVEFRNICHNERVNDPQYINLPRGQDIGGAFHNGGYYEDHSNTTNQPWTGPITAKRVLYDFPFENYLPGTKHENGTWVYPDMGNNMRSLQFYTPERWTAVRNPATNRFIGLWSQSPLFNHETGGREQGKWEGQYGGSYVTTGTMYLQAIMDKRQVFDYEYTYMIGGSPQIMRDYAYARKDFKNVIDWDFSVRHNDWWMNNTDQAESPFDGSWYAPGDKNQMNRVSPDLAVDASKYTHIQVTMAVGGNQQKVGLSFLRRNNNGLLYDHTDVQYQFDVIADGQMRTYEIDLRTNPNYGGILYRIYLDVFGQPQAGRWSRVKSVKGIYRP